MPTITITITPAQVDTAVLCQEIKAPENEMTVYIAGDHPFAELKALVKAQLEKEGHIGWRLVESWRVVTGTRTVIFD